MALCASPPTTGRRRRTRFYTAWTQSGHLRTIPSVRTGADLAMSALGHLASTKLRRAFSSDAQSGGLLSRRSGGSSPRTPSNLFVNGRADPKTPL